MNARIMVHDELTRLGLIDQPTALAADRSNATANQAAHKLTKKPTVALTKKPLSMTPRMKTILAGAEQAARELGDSWIGVEHLAIALTAEGDNCIASGLRHLGVDPIQFITAVALDAPPTWIGAQLPPTLPLPSSLAAIDWPGEIRVASAQAACADSK